ncbi:MAG TPA: M55 family metallopeptidase [Candidatus Acidoferrales bacterium]|nr:M55 family metallopeptidase [Candidatus Acidoferrales bacterium]
MGGSGIRIYISCDMEGVAGIVDWRQVVAGAEQGEGQRLLLAEVNAAIDGAETMGATSFLVNDSHGAMRNLPPDQIHGEAEYCSGQHKPLYMMEGLDEDFDACFFIGYHGAVDGAASVLSHTYSPAAIQGATLNGHLVGESGINTLVASHFRVPVALISGDQHTAAQAESILRGAEMVVVKQSLTRLAARSLHPAVARRRIHDGAISALARLSEIPPPTLSAPFRLEVRLRNADLVQVAIQVRGVRPVSELSVLVEGDDALAVYRSFVGLLQITRGLGQGR